MDKQTAEIAFTIGAITIMLIMLTSIIFTLLLAARNRKLKFRNELLSVNANYQRELLLTKMEVAETTLSSVSHQLHDEVGQLITFSIVQLNSIQSLHSPFQTELNNIRESVQHALQAVREISKTLSTDYLATFGINESIIRLINRIPKAISINCEFYLQPSLIFKSASNELFSFRIIQELITNTIKHAEATIITISITTHDENILIEYSDNGKGLPDTFVLNDSKGSGLGLLTIFKRVELMKGTATFEKLTSGFKFCFTFPNY